MTYDDVKLNTVIKNDDPPEKPGWKLAVKKCSH